MKILIASDGFLTDDVLTTAIQNELPDAELSRIASTWPTPAFGDVGDVQEALGDEDALIEALQGNEVVISHTFPFTEKVIAASPDLKLITICRGGPVNVNIDAATKHGVMVSYAPGRNARATAEHSVAMLLAAARQIAQRHMEVVNGEWATDYYLFEKTGQEVGASTVGVIGYGAIGARVAAIMSAFGARVLVFDPFKEPGSDGSIEFVGLDQLLAESDFVTLHARVTDENRHMINADSLAKMKKGSILVNCARGPLVDYDAVCDSIDSGHLHAAAFDCLPEEPLPADHRLLRTPRITFTPHLAGASQEASRVAARIGSADIAAYARGELPTHLANPDVKRK
ncbi:MAG: 2-hydroxyacid dehydrogenase [Flaviflexus sp.]|uniref:2-hydroxyacid dehydrogenase n=1 Tax=Flaviflexus sp. TaxID=1969482 RepID=UPI003F8DC459